MATWAKGIDFKNSDNSARVGGVGVYGTDSAIDKLYLGMGAEPWNNAGLELTASIISFKGNKIYHTGDKPTPADIGAATSSHTHNYAGSSSTGGNANAAVKLATARTLTIGSTGKTFDGSANVSWSLSEIGAAAASHTHSYLPLSGGTLTGETIFNNYLSINAWSGYGTGKAQLWFDGNAKALKLNNSTTDIVIGTNYVYHGGRKPTPADIGAAASSHTHSYLPLSGGTLTGKLIVNSTVNIGTDPNGKAGIGYDSTTTDTYICNSGGNWLRLKTDKTMTYAGYKVYTSYEKPTASDVSALALSGGTLTGNASFRSTTSVAGAQFYRGTTTTNYTRLAQAYETGGFRIENYQSGAVGGDYVFEKGSFSPRRTNPYLGYPDYRWGQIYSTVGSISTSDSKLKENVKLINRSEVRTLNNEATSYDFYNYIKGTGIYTFNYKKEVSNDNQTWLGILADEIPDNIFDKIGMMSKSQEQYQKELEKQNELIAILEKTPTPLNEEEAVNNIIEGTSYTYDELKYEAERIIEEPIRMINSSSQIAMLQEVLSIALNKIDVLESILKEKGLY